MHPDDRRLELVATAVRRRSPGRDHVPAAGVDLVGERQRHRLAGAAALEVSVRGDDSRDPAGRGPRERSPPRRRALTQPLTTVPAKPRKSDDGAVDPLDGHPETAAVQRGLLTSTSSR